MPQELRAEQSFALRQVPGTTDGQNCDAGIIPILVYEAVTTSINKLYDGRIGDNTEKRNKTKENQRIKLITFYLGIINAWKV